MVKMLLIVLLRYSCLKREQEGTLESIWGTLDRKSNGSPSNIDSNVEMVST